MHGPYQARERSGAGHLMIALDIAAFQPIDSFGARMDEMIAGLKAVPLAQGYDEVFYPGEIEARNDADHRRAGLQLPDDTLDDLRTLAVEIGLADRLPFP
ncbi:Ldh family oxidoreductase [Methylobacterium sp. E-065]|uniref:Ldh family oxidoreductase n=1 Tax=Methylobacterium sp. E-065 TaxID=2836583 RepID=UPI001FBA70E0|nr:Ldh family oxidoreductase [Methylobacterium sp. E-065]MCJ2020471.1 Ldh family oxidoreductase [Methylobacterium sp. E-065]